MNRYEEACELAESLLRHGNDAAIKDLPRIKELIDKSEIYWSANCDGYCFGWDGLSYRCDCDNRRVYWEWRELWQRFEAVEY